MAVGTEHTDPLIAWQPGAVDAARTSPFGALAQGFRCLGSSKPVVLWLWGLHLAIVDGGLAVFLLWLRGVVASSGTWLRLVESTPSALLIDAPVLTAWFRAVAVESAARPLFRPSLFFLLLYAVLAGGVIAYLHAPRPAPLLAQLGGQSGRYLGRFTRLLAIAAIVFWTLAALMARLLPANGDGPPNAVAVGIAAAVLVACATIIDYARVRCVARDSRSMILETLHSARFCVRNLPRILALEVALGLTVGAAVAVAVALHYGLQGALAPSSAGFVSRQVLVLGLLSLRVVAWGAMLSLYQGITLQRLSRQT